MSIELHTLYYELGNRYELKLIAGEQGLSNEVAWVQFCEDGDNTGFFRGNDLAITTGLCKNQPDWLFLFVQNLFQHEAVGAIVNIGKYLQMTDITADVLSFCEEHSFPLFVMPWHIHISDIMQECYNRIFYAAQKETGLTELVRTCVFQPEKAASLESEFCLRGVAGKDFYFMVFEPMGADLDEQMERRILLAAKTGLNPLPFNYVAFWQQSCLLLVLIGAESLLPAQAFERLTQLCKGILPKSRPIGGVSSAQPGGAVMLAKAYHEAGAALAIARLQGKELLSFDALGTYRLLFSSSDIDLLRKMHRDALQPLLESDAQCHTQLYKTLRVYLFSGCSLQAAADKIFTHRNTVSYRIGKIRSLLDNPLETAEQRFELMQAYYIADYLRIVGG